MNELSRQDAEALISGAKTFEDFNETQTSQPEQTSEPSTADNTETAATETVQVDTSSESGKEEENSVSSDTDVSPEKVNAEPKNKKGKTKLEKQQYAFKREKDKRREVMARLEAKQREIEELQAKLQKYEGLKLEHFNGDNDAFTDYKLDQRIGSEKVSRLQQEYNSELQAAQIEEAQQIADYRLQVNFPDEQERNSYQNLIMQAESDYASMHPEMGYQKFSDLLLSEKDKTLINYLQDSDNSPKLIRHFIHKPEAALKIMTMRNPYNKIVELKQLENRMMQHERVMAAKGKKLVEPKRELPNTGKVVTNTGMNSGVDWGKPLSKKEAEQLLAKTK